MLDLENLKIYSLKTWLLLIQSFCFWIFFNDPTVTEELAANSAVTSSFGSKTKARTLSVYYFTENSIFVGRACFPENKEG